MVVVSTLNHCEPLRQHVDMPFNLQTAQLIASRPPADLTLAQTIGRWGHLLADSLRVTTPSIEILQPAHGNAHDQVLSNVGRRAVSQSWVQYLVVWQERGKFVPTIPVTADMM